MDVDLQQRAVEYLNLEKRPDLAKNNVTAMPPWEKRQSLLLRRLAEREVHAQNASPENLRSVTRYSLYAEVHLACPGYMSLLMK
jgi:hypothetical protein